jgi:hypothetical protein
MDFVRLKHLYNYCRDEPLAPEDPRNVDFDRLPGQAVRGVAWVDRLAKPIELSDRPTLQLITGLPGSGKSTELRRLEKRLVEKGFIVARIDSEEIVDLTQSIDVTDIIAIMVDGAEKAVNEALGKLGVAARSKTYLFRLWQWLSAIEVDPKELETGAGPVSLTVEMKVRPTFRQTVRAALTRHFSTFLADARRELESLDRRVKEQGQQGVCVIFDSLEKLRGLERNWIDVLDSAVRVFGAGAPYLRLPVHCLYTVPPALLTKLNVEIEFMPMVKLRDRTGRPVEEGFKALRELVRHRMGDADLEGILGPAFEDVLRRSITRSGGFPREIIRDLRWLMELPDLPARSADLDRLANERAERYRSLVLGNDAEWLAKVAIEKILQLDTEEDRIRADRALQNNVVMRYLNQDAWFDLHPDVREVPAVQQAIARLSP